MTNLFLKQKVFSWGDKFTVYDEHGDDKYYVTGKAISLGKKLRISDLNDTELAYIRQKVMSFFPRFFIERDGAEIAQVRKHFTLLKHRYTVEEFGWEITGNFTAHEYEITQNGDTIVSINKRWFTWGDTYEISIRDGVDVINALAVVLVIDACIAQAQAAAASST